MNPTEPIPQDPPPRRKMTPLGIFLFTLGAIVLLLVIAGLAAPMVLRCSKKSELTQALNNARNLGMALTAFEHEYGRYPDAQTAADVAERTGSTLAPPGTTANAHLRQLIAAGILDIESMGYAKTRFTRHPDEIFTTPESAFAPGELGFGYLLNGDTGFSTENNPSIFLLCSPLAMDGKNVSTTRFDPDMLYGRMVMLRIDNAATSHPINPKSGELLLNGKPWLTTGSATIWGTEITPHVAPPEPK